MSNLPAVKSHPVNLVQHYEQQVEEQGLVFDLAQLNVVQHLQVILDQLAAESVRRKRWFGRKKKQSSSQGVQHLYIYGEVGRGKSMLMDMFYHACPISRKRRVHFHTFMQEVHQFVHNQAQQGNVMSAMGKEIGQSARLLCFDEFHVTDIADAMIMERLFQSLFDQGVCIVITSNRHPSDLYQGGLLREQFLRFVNKLLSTVDVVELTAKEDYRLQGMASEQSRFIHPVGQDSKACLQQRYHQLSDAGAVEAGIVQISGRKIQVEAWRGRVLWATFSQLCRASLGSRDFLALVGQFDTVILEAIPKLSPDEFDAARRLSILIDILYENKRLLICSCEVKAAEIYTAGDGVFEFQRTVSRLIEMQSQHYLAEHNQQVENKENTVTQYSG